MTEYWCIRCDPPNRATQAFIGPGFDPAPLLCDICINGFKEENPSVKGTYQPIDAFERAQAKSYITGKLDTIRKSTDEQTKKRIQDIDRFQQATTKSLAAKVTDMKQQLNDEVDSVKTRKEELLQQIEDGNDESAAMKILNGAPKEEFKYYIDQCLSLEYARKDLDEFQGKLESIDPDRITFTPPETS